MRKIILFEHILPKNRCFMRNKLGNIVRNYGFAIFFEMCYNAML